jgi:hypothetical protein
MGTAGVAPRPAPSGRILALGADLMSSLIEPRDSAGVRLQARGVLVICHAALTGLLAKADQASDQADAW